LANESQITALGAQSLKEVTQFLRHAALPASGADPAGTGTPKIGQEWKGVLFETR
jgi:hypothetical protein